MPYLELCSIPTEPADDGHSSSLGSSKREQAHRPARAVLSHEKTARHLRIVRTLGTQKYIWVLPFSQIPTFAKDAI